jgi:hypothetical protein
MSNKTTNILRAGLPLPLLYDNAEFTVASGLTNYDVKANEADAFVNFDSYSTLNIRSDQTITVRLNATTNKAITVQANKPFELENKMLVKKVYITNSSGVTANIKQFGTRQTERE